MYSLSKTRTYKANPTTIADMQLPLSTLVDDYKQINEQFIDDITQQKAEYRTTLELNIVRNYPGEGSYEGDFAEYDLEAKVAERFADRSVKSEVDKLVTAFAKNYAMPTKASWLFPAILAEFAKLPLVKNDNGLYSSKQLYIDHIKPSVKLTALWLICRHQVRGDFVKGQTDALMKNYSSLVPIIMSAFKRYNNVPYSAWDPEEIFGIVEPNLVKAMTLKELPEVTVEEILDLREYGLTTKSTGVVRSAISSYTLYLPAGNPLAELPTLAKLMMCQTWCAHPTVRTPMMILNPLDWDSMPPALVNADPIISKSVVKSGLNPAVSISVGSEPW